VPGQVILGACACKKLARETNTSSNKIFLIVVNVLVMRLKIKLKKSSTELIVGYLSYWTGKGILPWGNGLN
jgi:hypothetical protein